MTLSLWVINAALVLALMTALWLFSVWRRDASIVDPWWSMGFLLVTAHTVLRAGLSVTNGVLLALVAAWALRLWLHLVLRARGKPEDPRYAAFRQRFGPQRYWWVSFFQVFLLQGALVVFISSPLQVVAATTVGEWSWWRLPGVLVFLVGLGLEVIADAQLQAFRDAAGARGPVLDTGLFRYSRHPNYFGEAVLWWGLWLYALPTPWGWVTVFAPAVMTWLLVSVSGVAMLDALLAKRKPGYAEYMARTSGFVLWPRKVR